MLAVGLAFVFLARETHGQAMRLDFADGGPATPRAARSQAD